MYKSTPLLLLVFILLVYIHSLSLWADQLMPINADAVGLVELDSSRILYGKELDRSIAPASLTKMMSLHLAYQALKRGVVTMDQAMIITPRAYYYNQPTGSSIMELDRGQYTTLNDLMLGLALPSGNDGAVALAENIAGSVELFVEQMNSEAQRLGLTQSYFVDPAGVLDGNITTVRDWLIFTQFYIKEYPHALVDLHSVVQFEYPRPENYGTSRKHVTNRFRNRNDLLLSYPGADGIKTGYVTQSGYNLAATAINNQMRLIAVVLGVQANNVATGSALRTADATTLLDYGFNHFQMINPMQDKRFIPNPLKVFGSPDRYGEVYPNPSQSFLFKNDEVEAITYQTMRVEVLAPITQGDLVGQALLHRGDGEHEIINLYASSSHKKEHFLLYLNARLSWWIKQAIISLR